MDHNATPIGSDRNDQGTGSNGLQELVARMVSKLLDRPEMSTADKLTQATVLLINYQAELVKFHVLERCEKVVQSGPFRGMRILDSSSEGCYVPRLLGTYEQELHGLIAGFPDRDYSCVLNIGCGDGYYAVGLARLIGDALVYAFDHNPKAARACKALADINGVTDRVIVGDRFDARDFASFESKRNLVVCDIEGDEVKLLDPAQSECLKYFDLLVETHEIPGLRAAEILIQRFGESHEIEIIRQAGRNPGEFEVLDGLTELGRLIALWEFRQIATPWIMFRSRNRSAWNSVS